MESETRFRAGKYYRKMADAAAEIVQWEKLVRNCHRLVGKNYFLPTDWPIFWK